MWCKCLGRTSLPPTHAPTPPSPTSKSKVPPYSELPAVLLLSSWNTFLQSYIAVGLETWSSMLTTTSTTMVILTSRLPPPKLIAQLNWFLFLTNTKDIAGQSAAPAWQSLIRSQLKYHCSQPLAGPWLLKLIIIIISINIFGSTTHNNFWGSLGFWKVQKIVTKWTLFLMQSKRKTFWEGLDPNLTL